MESVEKMVGNFALRLYCDIYEHCLNLQYYYADKREIIEKCRARLGALLEAWKADDAPRELETAVEGLEFASISKMKDYVFDLLKICIEYEKGREN